MDRKRFIEILEANEGVVVVKYGATWCKPCKVIEPYLEEKKKTLAANVSYHHLDVDEDFDLYALFRSKKQIVGVPVLLAFKKGNITPFADKSVTGTSRTDIDYFFHSLKTL
jgi:thioredoxin 1